MAQPPEVTGTVVVLAGGVGGAKLAHGFAQLGLGHRLAIIVNTADDFELYGLTISPDLDTVMYTLAGIANPATGWGILGDTANTLAMLGRYGRPTWFWLGDRDLATHILRTERLHQGARLTEVISELAGALGVAARILPMCDEPVRTIVHTPVGDLPFQEYFVRRRQQDPVLGVRFDGIEHARPTPEVERALEEAEIVVLAPSNPIVSIGPLLALPGFRERLRHATVPIVAVSPIVGGRALKGPADRMLASLGHEVSPLGVARLYQDFLDGLVIDVQDTALADALRNMGIEPYVTDAVMHDESDRARLARETLDFARRLHGVTR
ncbi:2-phospho-L-lactate transferase [Thermomicrobium sp. 4228-Ro]|uniref:2-phospho-L-lactate transferase n=1 Tax=Thermomicrobium sp. 4228-Ro TaxID=2993937 RepID=UPI0022498748|nr:2-phospho-L-lactate transferase [Thermomicrobium sp. 4228-Ro]MCX2727824.1 2-phospho-L-lactate transferase [Thermomicrobium sp. 4228-Ro]